MLNILFIGDISGKMGRAAIQKLLPGLKKELKTDFVIANAENAAHGSGITEDIIKELMAAGVDCFTLGDHAFDREKQSEVCLGGYPVIRPANFPPAAKGRGHMIINAGKSRVLLINLIGRVFMHMDYDCPFRKLDEILANINLHAENVSAIIVDIHAEATSEKVALGKYADGRISALLGTHTHIPTADPHISDRGTAYITDVGMTGYKDGVIGVEKDNIINTFLTQIKRAHSMPEKGEATFNAVLLKVNTKTRQSASIKQIIRQIKI